MKAKVISAFPACGKTTYYNKWGRNQNNTWKDENIGEIILDSDSSNFSWVKDGNGNNTKERHPDFPNNYIKHIKDNLNKAHVIFVSSHEVVRKALEEADVEYHLFYPDKSLKDEWIRRFRERGNDEGFISFISNNWDNFIDDIEKETFPTLHKLDNSRINNEYICTTNMMRIMDYTEC